MIPANPKEGCDRLVPVAEPLPTCNHAGMNRRVLLAVIGLLIVGWALSVAISILFFGQGEEWRTRFATVQTEVAEWREILAEDE